MNAARPRIAITLGDVAGIGPEVTVQALLDERVRDRIQPLVIGHPAVLTRAADLLNRAATVTEIDSADVDWVGVAGIPCWNPAGDESAAVPAGKVDSRAGEAAWQYLLAAIDAAQSEKVDAITTAPLSKAALHAAGHIYPGHTEIIAERCGVREFAMMLYLPAGTAVRAEHGLGVGHVTLHTSVSSVPGLLTPERVLSTIRLVHEFMQGRKQGPPRIGVCALNPHAGEDGLFGDEEQRLIAPAVAQAKEQGIDAVGPLPADTLFHRAADGEFDGVVAMYHDQGHIALKLLAFGTAVNVTLGLPIVRTSPSHGTAFDIAWQGQASAEGMVQALLVAADLARLM